MRAAQPFAQPSALPFALLTALLLASCQAPTRSMVFQTDFGVQDGAVSAMKGVALEVDPRLVLQDLTHEIPPFDVWQAAYRLHQTAAFWPPATVFVSVVDPGVGTDRLPVVAADRDGRLYVTPDNGTLTLLLEQDAITAARVIDAQRFRRPGSENSHTFHGRDVFSYVGARLAAGRVAFDAIGPEIPPARLVRIDHPRARVETAGGRQRIAGFVPVLDVRYGNVWTDIPRELLGQTGIVLGATIDVRILDGEREVFAGALPYVRTFGDVASGAPLAYDNSLGNLAFALNLGDFAKAHGIGSGPRWRVLVAAP